MVQELWAFEGLHARANAASLSETCEGNPRLWGSKGQALKRDRMKGGLHPTLDTIQLWPAGMREAIEYNTSKRQQKQMPKQVKRQQVTSQ